MNLITAKQFREKLHITNQTLYNWRNSGLVKFQKFNSKYFLYDVDSVILPEKLIENKINIVYSRVSNTKQKEDLKRQSDLIREFVIKNGYICDLIIEDIASGMNEERIGFSKLMELVFQNKVSKIFISYKDRLVRFGFKYFEKIFKHFGTEIIVLNSTKEEDFQQELTEDLISIIHHFSMKLYSNRRKVLNKLKEQLKDPEVITYDNNKVAISN